MTTKCEDGLGVSLKWSNFLHNEASSSSSRLINIDLNELPAEYETEEPQRPCCSLTLLGEHYILENPPNPNPQSSPSSNKKRRSSVRVKKAKKRIPEPVSEAPPPKPDWLVQVMRDMNEEEDAKFIYEKTLSESDVNPEESRFLIPFKKLKRNDFLTQLELSHVEQDNKDEEGDKPGMGAILVNQRSEKWGLLLKIWKMKKKGSAKGTLNYALNCGWNEIVKGNELKPKDKINLLSFRSRGILCFALVVYPPTIGQSTSAVS